ncbi:hypothetical protein BOX15_Mlig001015g1 [Macrostomum lignano]|uniref:Glucose-induced degradation protein 4 homolog n=1 Tax=Macrostomum lignano TaxID=282301 RepID=A0A267GGG3_9PLAT|nr:hypothetical protein BOX15_Mlig001015g1 [Macrostomum lignano]
MYGFGCLYNCSLPLPMPVKAAHSSSITLLYNGSKFKGTQKSKGSSYDVEVTILNANLESHRLCGQLSLQGPSMDLAMTTYFEGELVGQRHSFLTRKWDVDDEVDRRHWSKFPAFAEHLQSAFEADTLDYAALEDSDFVFMRWKERFSISNCSASNVSFAGFYYICFQKSTGHIDGYYYHRGSEMFQTLSLNHVSLRSSGIYEPM